MPESWANQRFIFVVGKISYSTSQLYSCILATQSLHFSYIVSILQLESFSLPDIFFCTASSGEFPAARQPRQHGRCIRSELY